MLRELERVAKRLRGRRALGDGRKVEDGELGEAGHGYRVCQAMFVFFSNRLGCMGSLLVSAGITFVLLVLFGVFDSN